MKKLIFNYGEKFKQVKFSPRLRLLIIYPNKISLSKSVYKKNKTFSSASKIEKILIKKKLKYNLLKNQLAAITSLLNVIVLSTLYIFKQRNVEVSNGSSRTACRQKFLAFRTVMMTLDNNRFEVVSLTMLTQVVVYWR